MDKSLRLGTCTSGVYCKLYNKINHSDTLNINGKLHGKFYTKRFSLKLHDDI